MLDEEYEYSFLAYPLQEAELADEVGIDKVIVLPWPGLFSALSMLLSDVKYSHVLGILASLDGLAEDKIERSFLSVTSDAL